MNRHHPAVQEDEDELISRSEIKRQMEALQALGEKITELRPDQQERIPMDETLRKAVAETRRIASHRARRRHFQYIGRLMRQADAEAIQAALDEFDTASQLHNQKFHLMENWRDKLLQDEDGSQLQSFIQHYPHTDIQQLRQLIRNAQKEQQAQRPPTYFRKLFRFIRETAENATE
ncbi:ribosome biogenesis factor YjgA [Nitrincola tapanii]|uniref:Dual-action ribosomal maturation protein DarP n=1 Tax=Nitrincola tapanii TaxID=1708751 RepID=A0A5A9W3C3_9GAMM|nr:ribosome biogenesis factor YjgA [Nitrincola tapanii]KAA0874051.1 DUF615 domain-containing protein [Nitrincola tapanii]